MAEVIVDGADDVCKLVCVIGVFKKLAVLFVKILFGFFLVAKDLDDLLAVYHFFNIAIDIAEGGLLANKKLSAARGNLSGDEKR